MAIASVAEVIDLYRFYHTGDSEVRALRGISLTVAAGEVVALVGPSGSGKTTLLSCIAGLDEPDGGHVDIAGRRMSRRPEADRARLRGRHIGMLQQAGNLIEHLTVAQNLRVPAALAGRPRPEASKMLGEVGLAARAHALPAELSGGETARAGLAVALALDPRLLIADEPTAEVDASNEQIVIDLILAHRRRGGAALIATHSATFASRADRVLHIADGRLVDVAG